MNTIPRLTVESKRREARAQGRKVFSVSWRPSVEETSAVCLPRIRKPLTAALVLALGILACGFEPLPPAEPAPTPAPVPIRPTAPTPAQTEVARETFEDGLDVWHTLGENGAGSEIGPAAGGGMLWAVDVGPEQPAMAGRQWTGLTEANGLTIRLTALDRSALLLLALQEADGSSYGLVLPLSAGESAEHALPFSSFGLQADSRDENGQLDAGQLDSLGLADITGHASGPGRNRIVLEEIVLWQGTPAPFDLSCGRGLGQTPAPEFRVGVDANYLPQGEEAGRGYWVGEQRVDPLELLAGGGANAFRLRLWVGEKGESKLDYATELAHQAQAAGLRPYLVLFLADYWADINKQPAPAVWATLPLEERAAAIETYARQTAQHFQDQGIELDYYEIGNEIDYGLCGVFADSSQPRDPAELRATTWPDEARLIRAAIAGVRAADPEARFMLHIGTAWDPGFAVAFFSTMAELGVDYDTVGLSFYPTAFGPPAAAQLCATLDRLEAEVAKPIYLVETAYPAETPGGGMFGDWRRQLPGYPLTPEGQAWYLSDLVAAMAHRESVHGVYYFGPGFWFSGELWGPFALFDGQGHARPAVGAFRSE